MRVYKSDTWLTKMVVKHQGQTVGPYTGVVCTISLDPFA